MLTGVALLIAATAYRKSVRDGERNQATAVTVWVADSPQTFHVKNNSNAAVYSVTVYYGGGRETRKSDTPYYQVGDKGSGFKKLGSWASIGPGEEKSAPLERNLFADPQIPWLYFRDADGVDWIRDYRARLKRHNYSKWLSELYYLGKLPRWYFFLLILSPLLAAWQIIYKRVRKVFKLKADSAGTPDGEGQSS